MKHLYQSHREPFYIIRKKGKRKKTVYYYRVNAPNGRIIGEWSTGETSRRAAYAYALDLERKGQLIPKRRVKEIPTIFREYFADYFLWEKGEDKPVCPYIRRKLAKGRTFSRNHAGIQRGNLKNYILPTFGDRVISEIIPAEVEDWLIELPEADPDKPISTTTANNIFRTLKTMLADSYQRGHIPSNPCAGIERLGEESRPRDILRLDEVDKLFNVFTRESVWPDPVAYVACLTAACTGMRRGEIRALIPEQIHADHIVVDASIDPAHGNRKAPKNNKTRMVPIPDKLRRHLLELAGDSDGYIFSEDGGKTPIHPKFFMDRFYKAMTAIGIDEGERFRRNIVFHSWRYFWNSMMQINGIPDVKVRAIVGHEDEKMTARYSAVPVEEYQTETARTIPELQARILEKSA